MREILHMIGIKSPAPDATDKTLTTMASPPGGPRSRRWMARDPVPLGWR
jgi:hypothetical protein